MTTADPTRHHLAQLNIGRLRHRIEAPESAPFNDALDEINALAERSPGFVWRLQDDAGNATSFQYRDDPLWILNLSVWESIDTLKDFTYQTEHIDFLRRRGEWFESHDRPHLVLWWTPAGQHPTIEEATARLDRLEADGPSPDAFTFREQFDPPT